jgi:mannose-6-phosphate isomerase-like protein (cupin superfamily)
MTVLVAALLAANAPSTVHAQISTRAQQSEQDAIDAKTPKLNDKEEARTQCRLNSSSARHWLKWVGTWIPFGLSSRSHHHSGVEGFFVADGQQCLETADQMYVMNKGDTLVVPAGIAMRLVFSSNGMA